MAMACLMFRAPWTPSRTCSISSRTNSPACVEGALPFFASSRARRTTSDSAIATPRLALLFSFPGRAAIYTLNASAYNAPARFSGQTERQGKRPVLPLLRIPKPETAVTVLTPIKYLLMKPRSGRDRVSASVLYQFPHQA
jgi:hypothetical protein